MTGRRLALAPSSIYTYVYIAGYFCDRESVLYDVKPELGGATFQRLTELSFLMERCMILNDTSQVLVVFCSLRNNCVLSRMVSENSLSIMNSSCEYFISQRFMT